MQLTDFVIFKLLFQEKSTVKPVSSGHLQEMDFYNIHPVPVSGTWLVWFCMTHFVSSCDVVGHFGCMYVTDYTTFVHTVHSKQSSSRSNLSTGSPKRVSTLC